MLYYLRLVCLKHKTASLLCEYQWWPRSHKHTGIPALETVVGEALESRTTPRALGAGPYLQL